MIHVRPLVVKKGVTNVRIDMKFRLFSGALELLFQLANYLRSDRAVLFGEESQNRGLEMGNSRMNIGVNAIVIHAGAHGRIGAGCVEGKLTAHAEANGSDFLARRH